tara:strand:+ start:112 stop:1095 length:984 start_codon:yes stop_codon:yes gene_type:complete
MAKLADVLMRQKQHLPTEMLHKTDSKFGNIVPAYNNSYDVYINFRSALGLLKFINQHGFYDQNADEDIGDYLRLFCSEAVLPGSSLNNKEIPGIRQGIMTQVATMRRMTDLTLTFFSQKDYYTNDVFNAWLEFISPTRLANGSFGTSTRQRRNDKNAFRRNKYPDEYKCEIEITAFSNDVFAESERFEEQKVVPLVRTPSSITYYIQNAFPVNIVAAPLAYGNAQLIKTSIVFKYDNFFVDRTSRAGNILAVSDNPPKNLRDPGIRNTPFLLSNTLKPYDRPPNEKNNTDDTQGTFSGRFEKDGRPPEPGNLAENIIFSGANGGLAF